MTNQKVDEKYLNYDGLCGAQRMPIAEASSDEELTADQKEYLRRLEEREAKGRYEMLEAQRRDFMDRVFIAVLPNLFGEFVPVEAAIQRAWKIAEGSWKARVA